MSAFTDGMAAVVITVTSYVAALAVFSRMVQPLRLRMVDVAAELLNEKKWSVTERLLIEHLLDTTFSFRVGMALPIAATGFLIDVILSRPTHVPRDLTTLSNDRRFHQIVDYYLVSISAVNPLAAMLAVPPMVASLFAVAIFGKVEFRDAVEEPALRASASLQVAAC